jgi:hypothetical protein
MTEVVAITAIAVVGVVTAAVAIIGILCGMPVKTVATKGGVSLSVGHETAPPKLHNIQNQSELALKNRRHDGRNKRKPSRTSGGSTQSSSSQT